VVSILKRLDRGRNDPMTTYLITEREIRLEAMEANLHVPNEASDSNPMA
jgi:hypothetical protein